MGKMVGTSDPCVLIVEDEETICGALGDYVRAQGYTALTACDGVAAVEALHKGPHPSLILLDLHMPGLNGWKFRQLQRLRADLADVPVVVMSSLAPEAQRREVLGEVEYLDKSRILDELPGLLERFCGPRARALT